MAIGVFVLTAAMLVGAAERGAADTTPTACPSNGKSICISISDQVRASITTDAANNPHYLTDHVTISNGDLTPAGTGTANLTNITLTITWADVGAATTSNYVDSASDARCTRTPNTSFSLTCTAPKSLGPGQFATFGPLIFRTATNVAATATNLHAVATAKEQAVEKQGKNPPTASVFTDNATPYEVSIDDDVSWAGGGVSVTLATSSQVGQQFSKMRLPATMPAGFATLTETDCPADLTCIGQKVSTVAVGLTPLNLQITYVGTIPSGLTEASLVLLHTRSGATTPTTIDQACAGASLGDLFSGVQPDNIPCRRVRITRGVAPGGIARVEIDAWDISNGDWTWR
jgi:hypothetical protein